MSNYRIVIHTTSRHLELYDGQRVIARYPVAVGKKGTPTPHGQYHIASKVVNPGGVFGSRWLGLSIDSYGIHGTNNPASIGQSISKGCVRMHNQHVESLFSKVGVGTPVNIVP